MFKQELSAWLFRLDGEAPIACTVPCSMYSILLDHGKIEDPFFRSNEKELTRLSEKNCSFETTLTVTSPPSLVETIRRDIALMSEKYHASEQ